MRLFAAIVPPTEAVTRLHAVVESVAGGTGEFDVTALMDMRIPVTYFGNVTQRDCDQMVNALRREAVGWLAPKISFAGGAALEFEGDYSVWSRIEGDLDALLTVGRGVPGAVKRLGFLVDRRKFRPWLAVGTITGTTSAPLLERLVAALDDFRGEVWSQDTLSIIRRVPLDQADLVQDVVIDEVPLLG